MARTGENLTHFDLEATLACMDAQLTRQPADCIATNLPYGVYSHMGRDSLRGILRNLLLLSPRITLVTSERIEDDLRAEGYEILQIIPVESERFERIVYLTRAP